MSLVNVAAGFKPLTLEQLMGLPTSEVQTEKMLAIERVAYLKGLVDTARQNRPGGRAAPFRMSEIGDLYDELLEAKHYLCIVLNEKQRRHAIHQEHTANESRERKAAKLTLREELEKAQRKTKAETNKLKAEAWLIGLKRREKAEALFYANAEQMLPPELFKKVREATLKQVAAGEAEEVRP